MTGHRRVRPEPARVLAPASLAGSLALLVTLPALATISSPDGQPGLRPLAAQGAERDELQFTYGVDSSSWYWERQLDEELSLADASQRVSLPNPQAPETLPVAVELGEPTKLSALRFDLPERGVPEGSTVTEFVLTIVEGTSPGDTVPTINPAAHELQACRAEAAWSPSEADLWDAQPESGECVTGERSELELDDDSGGGGDVGELDREQLAASWSFDLSELAAGWGEDTFDNHGVVFTPAVIDEPGPADTWQVNLLLPQRNDPNTPADEYEETVERVAVDLAYVPGEAEPDGEPDAPEGPPPGAGAGGGGPSGTGGAGPPDPGARPELDEGAAGEGEVAPIDRAAPAAFEPRMPWYVWLLLPAALLTAVLVRGALVETAPATRHGGVIETIRARNVRRRGGVLPVPAGWWGRLRATLSAPGRGWSR